MNKQTYEYEKQKQSQVKSHPHIKDFASPLAPRVPKKDQKLAGPTPGYCSVMLSF